MSSAAIVSAPDAALGERDVLGHVRVEVVADHQHVEMLVDRVDRERPGRVGRRGQHVRLAADPDDVGRVAAARALGVVGVDRPPGMARDRVLDEAGFVERVGVDGDLDVDARRRPTDTQSIAAGVVPQSSCSLSAAGAGLDLLDQRRPAAEALPLPRKPKFIGRPRPPAASGAMFQAPGVQVVALVPVAGPGAAADQRGDAAGERLVDLLRADEVDVASMPPAVTIMPSPAITSVAGADHHARSHAVHECRDCRPCRCRRSGRP